MRGATDDSHLAGDQALVVDEERILVAAGKPRDERQGDPVAAPPHDDFFGRKAEGAAARIGIGLADHVSRVVETIADRRGADEIEAYIWATWLTSAEAAVFAVTRSESPSRAAATESARCNVVLTNVS